MRSTICYVATYDPDYPRNLDTIRAFGAAGVKVEVVEGTTLWNGASAAPLWLRFPGIVLRSVVKFPFRLLEISVRLLRCQAVVVGYLGHVDIIGIGLIARIIGRPVIFNPLITLTDTIVEDRRLIPEQSVVAWLIGRLDSIALGLADLVLADTAENRQYMMERFNVEAARIMILPVGVDARIFWPARLARPVRTGELDVVFYGKFIPLHGIRTILRAASLLDQTEPGIRFELIGTGQDYAAARELARHLRLSNISWVDWLPYTGLGQRLRDADVALGIFDGGEKASRVVPNKVHQALACGVPVITRDSPAVQEFLTHHQSAMLVQPEDPHSLATAIGELSSNVDLRQKIGAQGRDAWEALASEEQLAGIASEALAQVGLTR